MIDQNMSHDEVRLQIHILDGKALFHLEIFGDQLAEKHGYRDLSGLEAVRYYLMQKHNWLPRDVNSMSGEELRFAMTMEMQGWTVPRGMPG